MVISMAISHRFLHCRNSCLLLLVFAAGCSDGRVPVAGTVTFRNRPLEHGRVGFFPLEGRPDYADIDANGRFTIVRTQLGNGLAPGKYRVVVQSDLPINPHDTFGDRYPIIPLKYSTVNETPLEADVSAERREFAFELTGEPPPPPPTR